jgi:hypothetical protein
MPKNEWAVYSPYANPYLACVTCSIRAVGFATDKQTVFTWPCLHTEDVVSVCPTWTLAEGCACPMPVAHGLPPEGDRDKRKGRPDAAPGKV